MKRTLVVLFGVLSLGALAVPPTMASDHGGDLLRTDDLVAVPTAQTNVTDDRGVTGAGAAWILSEGKARLRADGRLDVRVEGLVLDPATVPAPRGGTNPFPQFGVKVSCKGFPAIVGEPIAATVPGGDARGRQHVALPASGCEDPVVYITNQASGAWFAKTVADDEDDD